MSDSRIVYEPISPSQVPRNPNGGSLLNLYVYLPTPRKYILFVAIGDGLTSSRIAALERHLIPILFVRTAELEAVLNGKTLPAPTISKVKEFEILGQATNKALDDIYAGLLDDISVPPTAAIEKLESLSKEIIDVIAPDVQPIKARLLDNIQYVWIMNDAAALTSLAVLFVTANGIDSRKSLKELVDACLVMDLPLSKLGKDTVEKIILAPESMSPELKKEYEQHPLAAYQLAKKTLKHYSETTFELILTHHELNNSKGFPRQVPAGTLFPLARILAASVEAFERLKRAAMKTSAESASKDVLVNIVHEMREEGVEPHLRRHNREILDKVENFLRTKARRGS